MYGINNQVEFCTKDKGKDIDTPTQLLQSFKKYKNSELIHVFQTKEVLCLLWFLFLSNEHHGKVTYIYQ